MQVHLYWPFYGQFQSSELRQAGWRVRGLLELESSCPITITRSFVFLIANYTGGSLIRKTPTTDSQRRRAFYQFLIFKKKKIFVTKRTCHHWWWVPCWRHHSSHSISCVSSVSISGATEVKDRCSPEAFSACTGRKEESSRNCSFSHWPPWGPKAVIRGHWYSWIMC